MLVCCGSVTHCNRFVNGHLRADWLLLWLSSLTLSTALSTCPSQAGSPGMCQRTMRFVSSPVSHLYEQLAVCTRHHSPESYSGLSASPTPLCTNITIQCIICCRSRADHTPERIQGFQCLWQAVQQGTHSWAGPGHGACSFSVSGVLLCSCRVTAGACG